MNLYIMTRGRVGKQTTLGNLPQSLQKWTYLVCPKEEGEQHLRNHPLVGILPAPEHVTNYSQKFQWILEGFPTEQGGKPYDSEDKAVILDDDLVFSRKAETTRGSLITLRGERLKELHELFSQMEEMLEKIPLVGVHPRQMGNSAKTPFVWNGRVICIQGVNRRIIRERIPALRTDSLPILADVVLNCSLLSHGLPNALITTFFQDHGPCNADGGCSLYRTAEMQAAAARYIAARYSPYAKTVVKKPKVAKWLGETRTEFTVQWKKLYEYGLDWAGSPGPKINPYLLDKRALQDYEKERSGGAQAVE